MGSTDGCPGVLAQNKKKQRKRRIQSAKRAVPTRSQRVPSDGTASSR